MFRTTLVSQTARIAIVAIGLALLAAGPAVAKEDTISGQTPGHTVGGNVYPKGGGDPIPLADTEVDADGKATFIKPNVEIDRIEYVNRTTGNKITKMGTIGAEDLHLYLDIGNKYGLFRSDSNSLWTEHFIDVYDQSVNLELGERYEFVAGFPLDPIPGLLVWQQDGTGFTGSAYVSGYNEVGIPEPASLSLLALGGLVTLRRRRVRQV